MHEMTEDQCFMRLALGLALKALPSWDIVTFHIGLEELGFFPEPPAHCMHGHKETACFACLRKEPTEASISPRELL